MSEATNTEPVTETDVEITWDGFRDAMHLDSILLIKSHSHRIPFDPSLKIKVSTQIALKEVSFTDNDRADVTVEFDVRLNSTDNDDVLAVITMEWVAIYRTSGGDDRFRKLVGETGVYHIWPFAREFVASLTNRMGLETLLLPQVTAKTIRQRFNPTDSRAD